MRDWTLDVATIAGDYDKIYTKITSDNSPADVADKTNIETLMNEYISAPIDADSKYRTLISRVRRRLVRRQTAMRIEAIGKGNAKNLQKTVNVLVTEVLCDDGGHKVQKQDWTGNSNSTLQSPRHAMTTIC